MRRVGGWVGLITATSRLLAAEHISNYIALVVILAMLCRFKLSIYYYWIHSRNRTRKKICNAHKVNAQTSNRRRRKLSVTRPLHLKPWKQVLNHKFVCNNQSINKSINQSIKWNQSINQLIILSANEIQQYVTNKRSYVGRLPEIYIILQCCDTVGWVIWPVKPSPKWPIMCRVGR